MIQDKLKAFAASGVSLLFAWLIGRFPQYASVLTPELQALVVGAVVGITVHQVPNIQTATTVPTPTPEVKAAP